MESFIPQMPLCHTSTGSKMHASGRDGDYALVAKKQLLDRTFRCMTPIGRVFLQLWSVKCCDSALNEEC